MNLKEMDRSLDTYELPNLHQEDIKPMKNQITDNEVEAIILKNLLTRNTKNSENSPMYCKDKMPQNSLMKLKGKKYF